jgi:hypothetical protein
MPYACPSGGWRALLFAWRSVARLPWFAALHYAEDSYAAAHESTRRAVAPCGSGSAAASQFDSFSTPRAFYAAGATPLGFHPTCRSRPLSSTTAPAPAAGATRAHAATRPWLWARRQDPTESLGCVGSAAPAAARAAGTEARRNINYRTSGASCRARITRPRAPHRAHAPWALSKLSSRPRPRVAIVTRPPDRARADAMQFEQMKP